MDIEPTTNSIWFKGNNATYPQGRRTPHLELGRLINYVVENSVSANNVNAVNYMFWQDLNKWHFRSVDSLIREQASPRTYKISADKSGKDKILNFRVTKQLDQSELINSDAYKSFYIHVEPNHDDPYTDYMPVNDKIKKERIDYDYTVDYESWNHIEANPVLPDFLQYDDSNSNEIHDNINGWFSIDEYSDQHSTKFDYYKNDNHKNTMKCWQTNFDQTDLDYQLLKKIRNGVVLPAKTNYDLYVRKRLLKEKWNVYKYSICCDKQAVEVGEGGVGGARILGYITGFERYSLPGDTAGGEPQNNAVREIWKYNWVPVEMWPTEEVSNQEEVEGGITYDNQGNTYEIIAQEGPFTVIKIPQQSGVTLEAYNLNELANEWTRNTGLASYLGPGYNQFHLQAVNGLYDRIIEHDPINETVQAQFYMPVGGMLEWTNQTIDIPENLTAVGECKFNVEGQLVELFEIPSDLNVLGQTGAEGTTAGPSESVYLFNTENAVDGYCLPCILGEYSEGQEDGGA